MFVLTKLFYRLEIVDISNSIKIEIEKKIKNFIWNDRKTGRVELNALTLGYQQGGLQLYDIDMRIKTMRIKWLEKLSRVDKNEIERYLVDRKIEDYRGICGLRILNHDIELSKFPKINNFYRKAIIIWRSMGITFEGTNTNSIKDEIIYYNKLLVNNDNETFKFFSLANNHSYIPMKIRDLPVTQSMTAILVPHRDRISALNRAFWRMRTNKLGKYPQNCYTIHMRDARIKLEETSFKELYKLIVEHKRVNKLWESKWNEVLRFYTLDIADIEWVQVWKNVHNHLLSFEIQSTIWIMLHLNFYCGYKERLFNYGDGICKLCGEI